MSAESRVMGHTHTTLRLREKGNSRCCIGFPVFKFKKKICTSQARVARCKNLR